jgi:hypothetical protein
MTEEVNTPEESTYEQPAAPVAAETPAPVGAARPTPPATATPAHAGTANSHKSLVDQAMACTKGLVDKVLSVFGGGSASDKQS